MTGLYNRKILTPTLEQRLQRLVAAGTSVTFIAIDLDKLKMINDTQGHHEGDRAITLLAKAIEASVRKSDYAVRPGGDEFCIILIDAEPDMATHAGTHSQPSAHRGTREGDSIFIRLLQHAAERYAARCLHRL